MKAISGPEDAVRLGERPLLFAGRPPVVTGEVELHNASGERIKVRSLATAAVAAARAPEGAEARPPVPAFGSVRLAARLEPGASSRVTGHLQVDRFTAPGRYETRIEVGGRSVDAVVHVFENDAVRVEPNPVCLRGVAGETVAHTLVVTNDGNVAHAVPDAAQVFLGERDWLGRSLVYALREVPEDDHRRYLDGLLREFRSTLAAPARVKVSAGVAELAPGGVAEVHLEVVLPDALVKGRGYVGRTRLLGAPLGFEVDCVGTARTVKRRPQ